MPGKISGPRLAWTLAALLAGCTAHVRSVPAGLETSSRQIPYSVLLNVPFFADQASQCGPSALASLLAYWGVQPDLEQLKSAVYIERLKGSLPMDLAQAARDKGLAAEVYAATLEGLKQDIRIGQPRIAFLNLGYRFFPKGHYVVVVGYDDARGGVYLHSGTEWAKFMTYRRFSRHWKKTGNCALRVARPAGLSLRSP